MNPVAAALNILYRKIHCGVFSVTAVNQNTVFFSVDIAGVLFQSLVQVDFAGIVCNFDAVAGFSVYFNLARCSGILDFQIDCTRVAFDLDAIILAGSLVRLNLNARGIVLQMNTVTKISCSILHGKVHCGVFSAIAVNQDTVLPAHDIPGSFIVFQVLVQVDGSAIVFDLNTVEGRSVDFNLISACCFCILYFQVNCTRISIDLDAVIQAGSLVRIQSDHTGVFYDLDAIIPAGSHAHHNLHARCIVLHMNTVTFGSSLNILHGKVHCGFFSFIAVNQNTVLPAHDFPGSFSFFQRLVQVDFTGIACNLNAVAVCSVDFNLACCFGILDLQVERTFVILDFDAFIPAGSIIYIQRNCTRISVVLPPSDQNTVFVLPFYFACVQFNVPGILINLYPV